MAAASRFPDRYAREFLAGWGAMDFNGHMANWAYLNLAADVRMAFFAEYGCWLDLRERKLAAHATRRARGLPEGSPSAGFVDLPLARGAV